MCNLPGGIEFIAMFRNHSLSQEKEPEQRSWCNLTLMYCDLSSLIKNYPPYGIASTDAELSYAHVLDRLSWCAIIFLYNLTESTLWVVMPVTSTTHRRGRCRPVGCLICACSSSCLRKCTFTFYGRSNWAASRGLTLIDLCIPSPSQCVYAASHHSPLFHSLSKVPSFRSFFFEK